jgi:hypothetical protein
MPAIRLAFALSIALHAAALFWNGLPKVLRSPSDDSKHGMPERSLTLRLQPAAPPSPPAETALVPLPASTIRPRPRVPLIERPTPAIAPAPAVVTEPEKASPPPRPAGFEDFASFVASRQRAREAANNRVPNGETEQDRHNRTVAANLGLDRTPAFGSERPPGGGMFQVLGVTSGEAELIFYGWHKGIRRNTQQRLTVTLGDNPSIELALVRRMIAIIREHEDGDFVWESRHLGRNVTLSARIADNAGLEDVLMREFFPEKSR